MIQQGLISDAKLRQIKQGIWVYYFLLIFEGALRKWFLPGLATPLLVIRDPVALWLILRTWQAGLMPKSINLSAAVIVSIVSIFTALFLGHGNFTVALFGAKIMLLHFPLIYLIGRIFNKEDVIEMGKVTLMIGVPMAILVILQFFSPQSAWVNRGVGGDESGAGFGGENGYFRPSATFSFTTGTVAFFNLLAIFILYFLIHPAKTNKILLLLASAGLIIVIPLSISRSLFFAVILLLFLTVLALARSTKFLSKLLVGIGTAAVLILLAGNIPFFKTGVDTFSSRFESANEQEGGLHGVLIDRFLGGAVGALGSSSQQPFFGLGQGLGTNVGTKLTTGGSGFLIAEGEWARVLGELGPLMGLLMIVFRLRISFQIATAAYRQIRAENILPWLFVGYILINIPQGQWAQPTSLGFAVLIGGIAIASLHEAPVTRRIHTAGSILKPTY